MKRAWTGVALLSASWLFGLDYYRDAQWFVWTTAVAVSVALLTGIDVRRPAKGVLVTTAVLAGPGIVLIPWPYRAAAFLLVIGALLWAAPIPRRWPARMGAAGVAAGIVLVVQSVGLLAYEGITARTHELPPGLAGLPYGIARLIGIDAALDGTTIGLQSMRRAHELGATWELMLDPATWCFLFGGAFFLFLQVHGHTRNAARDWLQSMVWLVILVTLWLPIRMGSLMAAFIHRALRTEYDAPLMLMDQFWSPWISLLLLSGPALLAMRFIRMPPATQDDDTISVPTGLTGWLKCAGLTVAGMILILVGMLWVPCGHRKQGRILVDEHHSTWERTDRPYDTEWYGQESGYNYACIYDYCSRFYQMDRLFTDIEARTLDDCDVLVVKVPTSPYGIDEIRAIEEFVKSGGGLLLVGEHTSVFDTGLHLNRIAERFGFRFRYDCLFDIDTVFSQLYKVPRVPHPILQGMPPLNLAVSCSIDPGVSVGRAVIRSTGLRSLPADYHASNYYPQVEDRADARYGAFIQLWTTCRGAGRVAAFTDSTIFSNFSTFEPGKAELMLGMLEWLNHRNGPSIVLPLLVGLGVVLTGWGIKAGWHYRDFWLIFFGTALFAWSTATAGVRSIHQVCNPLPKPVRPFTTVVIDRTVCSTLLSTSGFIAAEPNGFGIFERWILRLGCFTSRREGSTVFQGDALCFLYPNKDVRSDFRVALDQYVASGGKVLLLDSPANSKSTANNLLYPFGLTVEHTTPLRGTLSMPEGWPSTTVDSACEIKGGTPLIHIGNTPVAATASYGRGKVMVLGFGSRFSDVQMGVTGDVIPDQPLRDVYTLQFRLLESIGLPSQTPIGVDASKP